MGNNYSSLQTLLLFLALFLFGTFLYAEGPPPLPKPTLPRQNVNNSNTNNTTLARLQAGVSHVNAPHTNTSQSNIIHPQADTPEQLSPPRLVRQASFATQSAPELTEESFAERRQEELFFDDEEQESYNPALDKPLFGKKRLEEQYDEAEHHNTLTGWTNKLSKPELTPLLSIVGSLLIVLAAFFVLAALLRKVSPPGNRPLPKEAFECLGRYYLTPKHQLQVLRLGNRIVLVSVMSDCVSTLAEITDPDETVAFLGLCRRLDANSATEMFRKTVANMPPEELHPPRRPVVTRPREHRSQLDLYSDPEESLASILARGRR